MANLIQNHARAVAHSPRENATFALSALLVTLLALWPLTILLRLWVLI